MLRNSQDIIEYIYLSDGHCRTDAFGNTKFNLKLWNIIMIDRRIWQKYIYICIGIKNDLFLSEILTIVSGVLPIENLSKSRMWPFWQITRILYEQFVRDNFLNAWNDIISDNLTKKCRCTTFAPLSGAWGLNFNFNIFQQYVPLGNITCLDRINSDHIKTHNHIHTYFKYSVNMNSVSWSPWYDNVHFSFFSHKCATRRESKAKRVRANRIQTDILKDSKNKTKILSVLPLSPY